MNKQEILDTLQLPFPCDFSMLVAMCRDPEIFEAVLSLAITQGKRLGLVETHEDYNRMFRGYDSVLLEN